MNREKVFFCVYFFVLVFCAKSQIKFFIEPEGTLLKPFGRIEKGIAGGALKQPVFPDLPLPESGISGLVRINNHNIKFGYRLLQAAVYWKITTPQIYIAKARGWYDASLASGVSLYSNQFHMSHSYLFKTKSFLPLYKLDRRDPAQKFLFRFAWFSIVGASVEWYSPTFYDDAYFDFVPTGNINIQERISYKFLRRNNYSIFAGGGIQFFHKNKERFKISLVYSQGIFKFYEFPITVTFDGITEYQGLMSTRGSFIGLFVSYPFLVWSNKRILKKKGILAIPETDDSN